MPWLFCCLGNQVARVKRHLKFNGFMRNYLLVGWKTWALLSQWHELASDENHVKGPGTLL
jgi:hypothetical protein